MKFNKKKYLNKINLTNLRSVIVHYYLRSTSMYLYTDNDIIYFILKPSDNVDGFLLRCRLQNIIVDERVIDPSFCEGGIT